MDPGDGCICALRANAEPPDGCVPTSGVNAPSTTFNRLTTTIYHAFTYTGGGYKTG